MPAWSDAAPQDESHHAEPPENRSTMTAYQKLVQSPSATPHASGDPITPSSLPQQNLYEISVPSHTPSFPSKIKCCGDRLRPPIECGHNSMHSALRIRARTRRPQRYVF